MKQILLVVIISLLAASPVQATERKQWKAPELKEGQTVQEALEELRQFREEREKSFSKEKQKRGFEFRDKKKRATKSEIDWLEPRPVEFNDLMDLTHDILFLGD